MHQQINLFNNNFSAINLGSIHPHANKIISEDGEVIVYENFFANKESDECFEQLINQIKWRQDEIRIFGKYIPLPRLTAWYGDEGKSYTYSGINYQPEPWIPVLLEIKTRIETITEVQFNSVLLNFYRHGQDSMSWHSDDEPELGQNPIIGSVSFGSTRRFALKHKQDKNQKMAIDLNHGSFLLMRDKTQHYWLHQISKTTKAVAPRINLTFRKIL